ncbi:hypothetical protein E4T42_01025 [Aureobasidium subglaciale]|nr:hypothetical protein E4T42_01025 [Aureobasidium subglaciale]
MHPKEQRFKALRGYIKARVREFRSRTSISPCAYAGYEDGWVDLTDKDHELSGVQWLQLAYDNMSPYTNWSRAEFVASLQQRNLPFPKLCNRKSYIAILRKADSEWQFRLFDLPKEIRLHIYEAALLVDMEQSLCYSNGPPQMRKNLSKPVLLHTCRQISLEATSAFYRINRFPLDCNDHYDFRHNLCPSRGFDSTTES